MSTDWRERLATYDDERLDPHELAEIERLLDTEPGAREYLAALRRDREEFRAAFAGLVARPGFTEAVMDRLPGRLHLPFPLPRLLEVCAALLMVAVVGSIVQTGRTAERARQLRCQAAVKDIARVVFSYADDYDGHLPDARNLFVQVGLHAGRPVPSLCPSDEHGVGPSYSIPLGLSGADVRNLTPGEVLVFDADGPFLAPRHDRGANVGYLDGRVELIRQDDPAATGWPWGR